MAARQGKEIRRLVGPMMVLKRESGVLVGISHNTMLAREEDVDMATRQL